MNSSNLAENIFGKEIHITVKLKVKLSQSLKLMPWSKF
jgi:hypothetical protein